MKIKSGYLYLGIFLILEALFPIFTFFGQYEIFSQKKASLVGANPFFVRPYDMFNEEVEFEGKIVKRFEFVGKV